MTLGFPFDVPFPVKFARDLGPPASVPVVSLLTPTFAGPAFGASSVESRRATARILDRRSPGSNSFLKAAAMHNNPATTIRPTTPHLPSAR
jgi:hypothetical protein